MPRCSTTSKVSADLPWTSTRCLRLLRPLMTRFHALRVYREEGDSSRVKRSASASGPLKRKARYGKTEEAQDTEWGFYQPRKRAKKTYSARQALKETRNNHNLQDRRCTSEDSASSQLGTLSVPTPYLNKTLARPVSAKKEHMSSDDRNRMRPPSLHAAQQGPQRGAVVQQLYNDFGKLLEQTNREDVHVQEGQSQVGAPSLLSMCLRNVPSYIANEEEWQKDDDDEDQINVTADTYNQLEEFGQGQERGWKHLKSVVQAHAICIVKAAIEANYISGDESMFPDLCGDYSLGRESWSLWESVAIMRHHPFPALASSTKPTHMWANSACFRASAVASHAHQNVYDPHSVLDRAKASSQYLYDTSFARARMSRLLFEFGQLPSEWLSCPCYGMVWQDVIKSFSKEDENTYEAFHFTHEYLLRSSGFKIQRAPNAPVTALPAYRSPAILEASTRTLTSLCAMLATIALVDTEANNLSSFAVIRGPARAIRLAAIEIHKERVDEVEDLDEQVILARISILLTDIIITTGSSESYDDALINYRLRMICKLGEVLTSREDSESKGIDHLSRQLCNTSKCYARATSKPDTSLLQSFLDKLIRHKNGQRRQARFVRRLALDTAIMFAQENPSAAAESYVHTLEMSITQFAKPKQAVVNAMVHSSPATVGRPGFRWEQGVCEWVASTPASLLKLKAGIDLNAHGRVIEAAQTPCHNAMQRLIAPSQVFIGVVVPSAATPSSPTKSGLDDVEAFDTPLRSARDNKRLPFEDSGIFMDEDEDAAVRGAPNNNISPALAQSKDMNVTTDLAVGESSPHATSPARPARTVLQSPSSFQPHNPSPKLQVERNVLQPRVTRSSQPSIPHTKLPSARPRPIGQAITRPKAPTTKKFHLLREDESEDELSINESDCCAGAFELTDRRSKTSSSLSTLLGTTVMASRSETAARRAVGKRRG